MNSFVEDLAELLTELANQRLGTAAYFEAQRKRLRRALIEQVDVDALRPYLPFLFFYCLESENAAPELVSLTHLYLVGQIETRSFVERLRLELAGLEGQNTLSFAYGIRSRGSSGQQVFTPILPAGVPVAAGQVFWHRFRITRENQRFAHLELMQQSRAMAEAETRSLHALYRARLPPGLAAGQEVQVGIERQGEQGLRLLLKVPGVERRDEIWWWAEISDGFAALVIGDGRDFLAVRKNNQDVRMLLEAVMRFLNEFDLLLRKEDVDSLSEWVAQTSNALIRDDAEALEKARARLRDWFEQGSDASAVFASHSLLVATSPPDDILDEFKDLAVELLKSREVRFEEVPSERNETLALGDWGFDGSWIHVTTMTSSIETTDSFVVSTTNFVAVRELRHVFRAEEPTEPFRLVNLAKRPEMTRDRMLKLVRKWYLPWKQSRQDLSAHTTTELLIGFFLEVLESPEKTESTLKMIYDQESVKPRGTGAIFQSQQSGEYIWQKLLGFDVQVKLSQLLIGRTAEELLKKIPFKKSDIDSGQEQAGERILVHPEELLEEVPG